MFYPIGVGFHLIYRGAKTEASKLRKGMVVDVKGRTLEVVNSNYTQGRARQAGNVQVDLKDIKTGTKVSARFSPTDVIESIFVEYRPLQYLYTEDSVVHFMDPVSFEQLTLDRAVVGEVEKWLSNSTPTTVAFINNLPTTVQVADQVEMTVAQADPAMKGATSDGRALKTAVLENSVKIQVPGYVEAGDKVIVKSKDGAFVKRVPKG